LGWKRESKKERIVLDGFIGIGTFQMKEGKEEMTQGFILWNVYSARFTRIQDINY
jgi:hypothetical protein